MNSPKPEISANAEDMKCKAYLKKTKEDQGMGLVLNKQPTKKSRKKKTKMIFQIPVSFQQLADNIVMATSTPASWNQFKMKDVKAWTNPLYPSWELKKKVSESGLWAEKLKAMSRGIGTNNKGENALLNLKYNHKEIKERKRIRGETSGLCGLPPPGDPWTFITSQCQGRGLDQWENNISDDAGVEDASDPSLGWSSVQIHPSTADLVSVRTTYNDSGKIESFQVKSHCSKMFEKMGLDEISLNEEDNKGKTAGLLPRTSHTNREISFHANVEVNVDDSLPLGSCRVQSNRGGTDVYQYNAQVVINPLDQNTKTVPEHWDDDDCSGDEASSDNPNISLYQIYEIPASLPDQCTTEAVFRKSEQLVIVALDQNSIVEHWDDDSSDNEASSNTTQISLTQRHPAPLPDQCPSAAVFGKSEQALNTALDQNIKKVPEHWGDDDDCSDNEASSNTTQISLTQRHPAPLPDQCPSAAVFGKSEQALFTALDQNSKKVPEHWDDDCSGDEDSKNTTKISLTQRLEISPSLQCPSAAVFGNSEQALINALERNNGFEHWDDDDDCSDNEASSNTPQISLTQRHPAPLPDQCPSAAVFGKPEQALNTALDQNSIPDHWDEDCCSDDEASSTTTQISLTQRHPAPLPDQCPSATVFGKSEQALFTAPVQNSKKVPDHWDEDSCSGDEDTGDTTKTSLTQRLEIPASIPEQCTSVAATIKPDQVVMTTRDQNNGNDHSDGDHCCCDEDRSTTTAISPSVKHEIPASLPDPCPSAGVFAKSDQGIISALDQNSILVPEHWDDDDCCEDDVGSNTKEISLPQKHEIPAPLPDPCTSAAVFGKSEQVVITALDRNSVPDHWDEDGCSGKEDTGDTTKISPPQKHEIPASLHDTCTSADIFGKSEQDVINALERNNGFEHWDGDDSSDDDVRSNNTKISLTLRHPASISDQFISETVFRKSEGQSHGRDGIQHGPFNSKATSGQAGLGSNLNESNMKAAELPSRVDASVRVISPELIHSMTSLGKEKLCPNVKGCDLKENESENSLRDDLSKISLNSRLVTGTEHSKLSSDLARSTLSTDKSVNQGSFLNSCHEPPDGRPDGQRGYSSPPEEPQENLADIFGRHSEDASKDSGIELSASATNSIKPTLPTESNTILTSSSDLNRNPLFTNEQNPMADSNRALLALSVQLQEEIKIKSQNLHAKNMLLAAVCQSNGQGATTPLTNSTSSSSQCAAKQTVLTEDDDRVERVLKKLSMQTARLRSCPKNRFPAQISPAKKTNPSVVPSSQNQEPEQTQSSSVAIPQNKELSDEELRKILTRVQLMSSTDHKIMKTKPFPCPVVCSKKSKASGSSSSKEEKLDILNNDKMAMAKTEGLKKGSLKECSIDSQSPELPQNLMHPSQLLRNTKKVTRLRDPAEHEDFRIPLTTTQCLLQTAHSCKGFIPQSSQYASAGRMSADTTPKSLQKASPFSKGFIPQSSQYASAGRMSADTAIKSSEQALPFSKGFIPQSSQYASAGRMSADTAIKSSEQASPFSKGFIPQSSQYASAGRMSADTAIKSSEQASPFSKGFIPQSSQYASAGRMSADTAIKSSEQASPFSKGVIPQNSQYASAGRMSADTTKSLQQAVPLRESVQIRDSSSPLSTSSKKFNRMPQSSRQTPGGDSSRNLPHSSKRPTNPSGLAQAALSGLRVESDNNQKAARGSQMGGANDFMQQLLSAAPVSRMLTSLKYFPKDRSTSN